MQTRSFSVSGASVQTVSDALADALEVTALVKHGDVVVLCHEKYYLRIDSNLMSTIVMSQVSETKCMVDIVTGGGKQGFLGTSFGAEKKNTGVVADKLREICDELELYIEAV